MKISKKRIRVLINEVMSQMAGPGENFGASGDYVSYNNNPNALKFKRSYTEGVEGSFLENLKNFTIATSELLIAFSASAVALSYAAAKLIYTLTTSEKPVEVVDAFLGLAPGKAGKAITVVSQAGLDSDLFKKIVIANKTMSPEEKIAVGKKIIEAIQDPVNKKIVEAAVKQVKIQHPDIQ